MSVEHFPYLPIVTKVKNVKVKVGLLYNIAQLTRWNQNSALHNLGSGSWLATANSAAALCGLSIARANGYWTRGCNQQAQYRSNQPHQAFTVVNIHQTATFQAK